MLIPSLGPFREQLGRRSPSRPIQTAPTARLGDLDPFEVFRGEIAEVECAAGFVSGIPSSSTLLWLLSPPRTKQRRDGADAARANQHRAGRRPQEIGHQRNLSPIEIRRGEHRHAGAGLNPPALPSGSR